MTAQVHENLILDGGTKTSMNFCPPLPEHHPRLIELTSAEIEKEDIDPLIFSTGCWRRYVGTWAIKDGYLYLVNIKGRFKIIGAEPIRAEWFTGVLRYPEGKLLHYVHMGFGSVYEFEVHMSFETGRLLDAILIDNSAKEFDKEEL